ncbi:MAG: hypothetical protein WDW36_006454 [Sanguina aurantia]
MLYREDGADAKASSTAAGPALFFEDRRGDVSSDSEEDEESDDEGAAGSERQPGSTVTGPAVDTELQETEGVHAGSSGGEAGGTAAPAAAVAGKKRKARAGTGGPAAAAEAEGAGAGSRPDRSAGRRAVWVDPEDAALVVDVSGQSRLRKLRAREDQTTMGGMEFEAALRRQHKLLHPNTSWASLRKAGGSKGAAAAAAGRGRGADGGSGGSDSADDEELGSGESEQELLASAGGLLHGSKGGRLPAGTLEVTRLKDANQHDPSAAVVQSVKFHPNGQLLLTAGLDKNLRFFSIDGVQNPKVQSIHFDDMPIHSAAFAGAGGSKVIATGRRPHFYLYDLAADKIERLPGPQGHPMKSLETFAVSPVSASGNPLLAFAGDQGSVPLVSLHSRQRVGEVKMSGSARSLAFSQDGLHLLTSGQDGVVYDWDLRTRRCLGQLLDQGNAGTGGGSSLSLSPDNRFIATGSDCGVVNVYRRSQVNKGFADMSRSMGPLVQRPTKELLNLTTSVDNMLFSQDSQILAISSRMAKDALRLVHLPTLTTFSNWPTSRSPLHYVHCMDFSPGGGYFAVGNAKGKVLLYRLHHFTDA